MDQRVYVHMQKIRTLKAGNTLLLKSISGKLMLLKFEKTDYDRFIPIHYIRAYPCPIHILFISRHVGDLNP